MSESWEPWARCYLKVATEALALPVLESVLGPSSTRTSAEAWAIDLEQSSDEPLKSQILRVVTYLDSLAPKLETLGAAVDVSLTISWTPRPVRTASPFRLNCWRRLRGSALSF
jgi:hypothetical protein